MRQSDLEIPVAGGSGGCNSHTCGAVRHIEDLGHEVDELRREVRQCERRQSEDIRKVWVRIAVITAAIVAVVPEGWHYIIGVFM